MLVETSRYLVVFVFFYFFGLLNRVTNFALQQYSGSNRGVYPLFLLQARRDA